MKNTNLIGLITSVFMIANAFTVTASGQTNIQSEQKLIRAMNLDEIATIKQEIQEINRKIGKLLVEQESRKHKSYVATKIVFTISAATFLGGGLIAGLGAGGMYSMNSMAVRTIGGGIIATAGAIGAVSSVVYFVKNEKQLKIVNEQLTQAEDLLSQLEKSLKELEKN